MCVSWDEICGTHRGISIVTRVPRMRPLKPGEKERAGGALRLARVEAKKKRNELREGGGDRGAQCVNYGGGCRV